MGWSGAAYEQIYGSKFLARLKCFRLAGLHSTNYWNRLILCQGTNTCEELALADYENNWGC